ncbi:MAG: stage II sporulation protein P [Bacillota bacterium]|nr:MAG: stage II sporulation protein P [Bacillota bacterium]
MQEEVAGLRVFYFRSKIMPYLIAGIMGLLLALALWPWTTLFEPKYAPALSTQRGHDLGPLLIASEKAETSGSIFWMLIFKAALPRYKASGERPYLLEMVAYLSDRVRTTDPHQILAQGISGLNTITFLPASPIVTTSPDLAPSPTAPSTPITERQPLIAIYHSHNSESFVPSIGQAHVYNDPDNTIIRVGLELAKELQTLGASVIHSAEDHVRKAFDRSYTRSQVTITNILNTYANVDYVFDIHRDGVPRSLTTMEMNGQVVARVYIVVGINEALGHPNWRENHAFAQAMQEKFEEMYPGFSRGILLRNLSRFNQHVHPNALLIEIGGHENSMEEALRATKYLAEVIMAMGK